MRRRRRACGRQDKWTGEQKVGAEYGAETEDADMGNAAEALAATRRR